jgi:hypothetical protein
MPWHTGEVLRELGYPLEVWQEPEDDDDEDRERVHTLTVERVPVRIIDDYRSIHVTIEGVISPPGIESLLEGLKRLLAGTGGSVKRHTEC